MLTARVLSLMCLAALLGGCGGPEASPAAAGGGARVSLVRVGVVTRDVVHPTTMAVGTVTARRTSVVASGADGKVDQFLVREGDIVSEGQELSVLNMVTTDLEIAEAEAVLREREQEYLASLKSRPEEIVEAKSRMEAAAVTRDVAADRLVRWERLSQGGAAAQDSLDDARERSQAAEKMYLAAKAAYDLVLAGPRVEAQRQAEARRDAQQHQVEFLKAEREKRITRAPFRGVVVEEHTQSGQWLSKGHSVVTLADLLDEVEVIAKVDQRELGNVQIGSTVKVWVDGVTPHEWTGTVAALVPRSEWEAGSRLFPVKVAVPNQVAEIGGQMQAVLREGMLVRVAFAGPPHEATLVPKNAIVRSETASRMYAVVPGDKPDNGKARPIIVQEGEAFGDRIEILNSDLQPGMQVVTEGAERLTPFADILIQSDAPAAGASPAGAAPAAQKPAAGEAAPPASSTQSPKPPAGEPAK
jgi:HlyD family secretion protein